MAEAAAADVAVAAEEELDRGRRVVAEEAIDLGEELVLVLHVAVADALLREIVGDHLLELVDRAVVHATNPLMAVVDAQHRLRQRVRASFARHLGAQHSLETSGGEWPALPALCGNAAL